MDASRVFPTIAVAEDSVSNELLLLLLQETAISSKEAFSSFLSIWTMT